MRIALFIMISFFTLTLFGISAFAEYIPHSGGEIGVQYGPAPPPAPETPLAPEPGEIETPALEGEPVLDAPDPAIDNPETVITEPDPVMNPPDEVIEDPQVDTPATDMVLDEPAPIVQEPEPLVEEPEPVVQEPEPLVQEYDPLANEPGTLEPLGDREAEGRGIR